MSNEDNDDTDEAEGGEHDKFKLPRKRQWTELKDEADVSPLAAEKEKVQAIEALQAEIKKCMKLLKKKDKSEAHLLALNFALQKENESLKWSKDLPQVASLAKKVDPDVSPPSRRQTV